MEHLCHCLWCFRLAAANGIRSLHDFPRLVAVVTLIVVQTLSFTVGPNSGLSIVDFRCLALFSNERQAVLLQLVLFQFGTAYGEGGFRQGVTAPYRLRGPPL